MKKEMISWKSLEDLDILLKGVSKKFQMKPKNKNWLIGMLLGNFDANGLFGGLTRTVVIKYGD